MTATTETQIDTALFIQRRFTTPGEDVWESVEWGTRDVSVGKFSQDGVVAPIEWSDQSVGIVAKIYFAKIAGERENSVRQLIERVVKKIVEEGINFGYFGGIYEDQSAGTAGTQNHSATIFQDELTYILLHQMAAFNTPVWLNFGVPGRSQVASACFLLSLKDTMIGDDGITDWWRKEAIIFKNGAGAGINVSPLRGSMEELSTGGLASGPTAYMRTADSGAGTLKSGGAHRRAAKMVCIDDDHPDVIDFISLKVREDERMRALIAAGFDLDPTTREGEKLIAECTTCQNANFSVRLSDAFMRAAENGDQWQLKARKTGDAVDSVDAREMLRHIAEASYACADPGLLFNDTINAWHTTPAQGLITTCNPCAEVHQNDDTACNLASINLLKFVKHYREPRETGIGFPEKFDVDEFSYVVDVMTTAMDITCSFSDLPTPEIEQNVRNMRQLGLGYCNMGAALMVQGMPYDSDEGRSWTGAVTALMTGRVYRRSAELAEHMGAFSSYRENEEVMNGVINKHINFVDQVMDYQDPIWVHARSVWLEALKLGLDHGFRNSQASVIAPTGTISFMMGADTTGCEPSIALVSYKGLASGGTITMVNGSVERALKNLGYNKDQIANIMDEVRLHGNPRSIHDQHRAVFATALGNNSIKPFGHIQMIAAIQPFISGASSKTVNIPEETTVEEIAELYLETWKMGIKALAIYRDGSKTTSVLSLTESKADDIPTIVVQAILEESEIPIVDTEAAAVEIPSGTPQRKRLPSTRDSITHKFSIGGHEGYITAGTYQDGSLGEIFLTDIGKEGSTLRGLMGAWATAISIALQYGIPLEIFARKFTNMNFEPHGQTSNPEIMSARSIVDYIMRWLISRFGDDDLCEEFAVMTSGVKKRMANRLDEDDSTASRGPVAAAIVTPSSHAKQRSELTGPPCMECGNMMRRAGTCYTCTCGNSTGCG